MRGEPDVSVCVTTFNHAHFVGCCLDSVLAQSFPGRIELLVGDDGSSDGTREVVADIAAKDGRVAPIFHSRNLGPTGNLAVLVQRARGRYIAHLDGDDAWCATKLDRQVPLLESDPAVVAVYSNAAVITPGGVALGWFNRGVPPRIDLGELMRRGNFLNHSSLLYRAISRDAVLGMDPPWIDYRLHVRLTARGALAYVDEPLVIHRWRTPGSMIKTMPRSVIDGHLDALSEALLSVGNTGSVRSAAGHAWGKVLMSGLLAGNLGELRYFSRRLAELDCLDTGIGWRAQEAFLAPWRALRSIIARRNGVYFP